MIQQEPICIFTRPNEEDHSQFCDLYFHSEYPSLTFEEFCSYVIIPRIYSLKNKGYDVEWGYVNSSKQTLEVTEAFLKECK